MQKNCNILVVDDETDLEYLIQLKFRRQILDKSYRFEFACNGEEALSKIHEFPQISLVLTDINMPKMDGLTLLGKLKEVKNPGIKAVIVTAYGDMGNIRTAMNLGAFDFITKPVNFDDLEITINKTLEEALLIRRSMEEHTQLISIQQDLTTARKIQEAILPKVFTRFPAHHNFSIYASMDAAKEVGGDFYDFFMIDSDRLGFVIGDVSGKGVPAALFMAISRTLIRATGIKGSSASECMRSVNNLLCIEKETSMFVTVFYGILNAVSGEIDYVNAGHNQPYLLTSTGISQVGKTDNPALGVVEYASFRSGKIKLKPGEKIFLYTDGVTEAFNHAEMPYGKEKLEEFLLRNLDSPVDLILKESIADVNAFVDGAPQSDDITLLALAYYGKDAAFQRSSRQVISGST